MARHTFGGSVSDWAFTFNSDGSVSQAAGAVLTFWDSLTGGTQYPAAPMPGGTDDGTGLLDGTGTPVSSVTCDGNGEIPDAIQGPDGIYRMAADGSGTGAGPRRWITANNMGDDLNTLFGDVAGIPALEAAPVYVYYDDTTAAYPPRPDTTAAVWWVGPVAPTVGGTGGATGSDVWLNTTGAAPSGGVVSVTAGDVSVAVGGSASAPTIEMGSLDQAVTLHPPAGPVPMNGQRLTGLANGLASTDAATVGQVPVIDTTATDIQPNGTQAAGGTGKAADAGHVHDWVFAPTGFKTANYSLQPHDLGRFNTSGGPLTATLPAAPADRTLIGAKIITAGNLLTINTGAGDAFTTGTGPTSMTMGLLGETVLLQYQASTKAWGVLAHSLGLSGPATSAVFKPANPSGTTSTTAVMMGLGSTISFTPRGSGIVKITLTGNVIISAGAAGGVTVGGRYGSSTAPANAATASGTAFGPAADQPVRVGVATSVGTPLALADRLALTAGTTYWFDVAVTSGSGNTSGVASVVAVLEELLA